MTHISPNRAPTFRRFAEGETPAGRDLGETIFQGGHSCKCATCVHKTPPCQGSRPSGHEIRGWLAIARGMLDCFTCRKSMPDADVQDRLPKGDKAALRWKGDGHGHRARGLAADDVPALRRPALRRCPPHRRARHPPRRHRAGGQAWRHRPPPLHDGLPRHGARLHPPNHPRREPDILGPARQGRRGKPHALRPLSSPSPAALAGGLSARCRSPGRAAAGAFAAPPAIAMPGVKTLRILPANLSDANVAALATGKAE